MPGSSVSYCVSGGEREVLSKVLYMESLSLGKTPLPFPYYSDRKGIPLLYRPLTEKRYAFIILSELACIMNKLPKKEVFYLVPNK